MKHADGGSKHLVVISNVPVNSGLLQRTAAMVGAISLYPPKPESGESKTDKRPERRKQRGEESVNIDLGGSHSTVTIAEQNLEGSSQNVEVGKVPPPVNRFDREFNFWTLFNATDWQTSEQETGALMVSTRPSLLYNVLFGRWAKSPQSSSRPSPPLRFSSALSN